LHLKDYNLSYKFTLLTFLQVFQEFNDVSKILNKHIS